MKRLLQCVLRPLSAVADRAEAVGGWSFRERYLSNAEYSLVQGFYRGGGPPPT